MVKLAAWVMAFAAILFAPTANSYNSHSQPSLSAPILTLSAEAGYGGYTKPGAWTPVRITVSNAGDPAEIVIQLASPDANTRTRTRASMSVVRGARRSLVLYAPPEMTNFTIQALDSAGGLLATTSPIVRPISLGDHLALAINDPPDAYTFLADGAPAGKHNYVAQLRMEQLPDLVAALDALDEIIIGNADTSGMTAAQKSAIRAWVVGGGQLVVAGGPGAALSARGLADLLPAAVEPALLSIQNPAQVMSEFARPNAISQTAVASSTTPAPAAQLRPATTDAQILLAAPAANGDWPLIVRRSLGRGVVDQLAFDPALGGWVNPARLGVFSMLSGGRVDAALAGPALIKDTTAASEAARSMPVSALPSVLLVGVFLALFVMALGPGNYFLLKRLNRLAWAWFTIPLTVLVFTALAAILGMGTRASGPALNRLTVWMGDARLPDGRTHTLAGIFAPSRATLNIDLGDGLVAEVQTTRADDPPPLLNVDMARPNRLDALALDSGAARVFYNRGQGAGGREQGTGNSFIEATLVFTPAVAGDGARVGGVIRNTSTTPLTDCVLIVGRDYQAVGNLAPGASAIAQVALVQNEAQSNFRAQDAATNPFGNYNRFRSVFSTAPRASQAAAPSSLYRNSSFDLKGPQAISALVAWRPAPDRYAEQAQQQLITALFDTVSRVGNGANVACWSAVNASGVNAPQTKAIDTSVFVWRLPVRNLLLQTGQTLPPDAFEWRITNGGAEYADDGLLFEPGASIMAFTPWLNTRTTAQTSVVRVELDAATNATSDQMMAANLSVYDWGAKAFVPVGKGISATNALVLTGAYASPAGEIRLRLDTGADGIALRGLRVSLEALER